MDQQKPQEQDVEELSDADLRAKTGRTWREWFALLDKDGAAKLNHQGIVKIVSGKYGIGSWLQQLIAAAYERARGLGPSSERLSELGVGASKVIKAPVRALHSAFADVGKSATWLKARLTEVQKLLTKRTTL